MSPTPNGPQLRGFREDHRRNHEALLRAALEVFDEQGIDAPFSTIADRSGVSVASLYRHFPTRDDLLVELYDRQAAETSESVIEILESAKGDAATRLDLYLDSTIRLMMQHPCYMALLERGLQLYPDRETDQHMLDLFETLLAQGQAAGALAEDVRVFDLILITTTVASLGGYERIGASSVWRRQLAIARRGLLPEAASAPLPPTRTWPARSAGPAQRDS